MPSPVRVIVPTDSREVESWHVAAACAQAILQHDQSSVPVVILLTHTKQQLRHSSLETFIGSPAAKSLDAGRKVSLGDGVELRHATMQTLRYSAGRAVIIAFYADDKMLDFVDGLSDVAGVVAVPDLPDSASLWSERWNPIVHGRKEQPTATALISDPVVEKALGAVTRMSNTSYSVMHPRDKDHANQTFRILRAKGHTLDAKAIKSWAIQNGWKPKAADELSAVAAKIVKLKNKPSLVGFHDPTGRYDRWKDN